MKYQIENIRQKNTAGFLSPAVFNLSDTVRLVKLILTNKLRQKY